MKHEKFKLIHVQNDDEITTDLKLNEFLASGVTPKSISVNHTGLLSTIVIGYSEDEPGHEYHLVKQLILMSPTELAEDAEQKLNEAAEALEGVVCQDVLLIEDGMEVIFLTTK